MELFIPSRSRFDKSLTMEALVEADVDEFSLVVPEKQYKLYKPLARRMGATLLACPRNGIMGTRQWIGEQARDKFFMIDDDLKFYYRDLKHPEKVRLWRFSESKVNQMQRMIHVVDRLLDRFVHVAISPRAGNNTLPVPYKINTRPLRALAFRKKPFLSVEHRVTIMEDFDVALQLMRKGFPNCVVTAFAHDQIMTQMEGGCSDYRTDQVHSKNVQRMAALHPKFVKLRWKENKTGGEFGQRLEATIYWDKAWKSSLKDIL